VLGETVVLWLGDCDGFGVCARTYDPQGVPLGPERRLELSTQIFDRAPSAALAAGGRLTVVWSAENLATQTTDIRARVFDLDLAPLGGEVVVAAGGFSQRLDRPDAAAQPGGGTVVVWARLGLDFSGLAIEGRRLDAAAAPLGGIFRVDQSDAELDGDPAVAADAAGDFLVAWESFAATAEGDDVLARGFDAAAQPLGPQFRVHLASADVQDSPAVAAAAGGAYLVAWESRATAGTGPGVYARGVTAAGPLGVSESRVNVATTGQQSDPAASAGGGGFAVAWQRTEATASGVWLRSFDLAGVPQGGEQRVDTTPGLHDGQPVVAGDGAGDSFVAWNRRDADFERQIFGRRYLAPLPTECVPGPTVLCLLGGRFQVEVAWHDQHNGGSGVGTAVPQTDQTGLFWFFNAANIELVVKVLDGRPVNGHFWVFYGALSDVEYVLTVTDVGAGERRFYHNDPGDLCGVGDAAAFPLPAPGSAAAGGAAPRVATSPLVAVPLPAPALGAGGAGGLRPAAATGGGACVGDDRHLCLLGDRFRVSVSWHDQHNGGDGVGHAVPFADKTGFFWFFNPANVELVVKMLDGSEVNGHFWVFYGALSDVEYTVTVTDTAGSGGAAYHNPPGNLCGVGDTTALPAPP
jgi:hypothetical protein